MGRDGLLVTPRGGMIDPLLEGALEVRHAFGATSESHLLAQVVPAFPADAALPARDADLEGDPVANSEARHLRSDGHDDA